LNKAFAMLSRTADSLYWLARYVERAEYLARTIEATMRLTSLPVAYSGTTNEWQSAIATAGMEDEFAERYDEANEVNVIEFIAFSPDNPSSIRNCIEIARHNARGVRTALTTAMWDTLNSAWLDMRQWTSPARTRNDISNFLRFVQETSLRFDGSPIVRCCAAMPIGSHALACTRSAPTTPRASSM